jgi:hypothetical protein
MLVVVFYIVSIGTFAEFWRSRSEESMSLKDDKRSYYGYSIFKFLIN